jgi:hypothetical protein
MLGTADDARMGELADALAARDCAAALNLIDDAILGGVDAGQLSEQLLGFFRDMMTAVVGCDAEMLRFTSAAMHERLREQGSKVGCRPFSASWHFLIKRSFAFDTASTGKFCWKLRWFRFVPCLILTQFLVWLPPWLVGLLRLPLRSLAERKKKA